ncbi:unnamed protein product [Rhizophagus irregularis]|nr:unnamed protein product [Rhizophagus irregularis]
MISINLKKLKFWSKVLNVSDDNIRKIKQEQNAVNILAQSNTSILKSPIDSILLPLALLADQINISPVADQYDTTESVKCFNNRSLEDDRKTDTFLNENSSSTTSESLYSKEKQVNLSEIKVAKILYNQKVEQDLIYELLEFIRCHNSTSLLNSISIKHVSFDTIPLGIGIDKIGVVISSADAISRLTDAQIQNIINLYTNKLTKSQKLISMNNCLRICDLPTESESKKSLDVRISTQKPIRLMNKPNLSQLMIHSYFRNKILDQYRNLYRECSSKNFDYYGITDETSYRNYICPLCKLGHDDEEIEGRYKAGSYFIKCKQHEIEIVA